MYFIFNAIGGSYEVSSLSSSFNKEKSISNPFCVFERGSTSETCKSQQDVFPEAFSNKVGTNYEIPTLSAIFDKAKNAGHSFRVFERGSTSGISKEQQNASTEVVTNKGNSEESKHFRTYIRTYNNMFAFTSLGVTNDKDLARRYHGIYTFRVQGQMYHFIPDLLPSDKKVKNLQLYFYDNENELANRMACSMNINESIVKRLMNVLAVNPYSIFLKSLANVPKLSDSYIALKCDPCLDQRVYNLPTATEVAGIWVQDNSADIVSTPHIRIYTHSNKTQSVNYYYGCYDPLQYPLLFPYGQNGWHCGIKKIARTNQRYCEHEELPSVKNMCSIDGFLDMEDQVLKKGKRKRETVSCHMLQGIIDFLRLGETEASKIGKKTFLPVTFIGGPRDMRRRYMDAIALVQRFGKPDLFITMTCNPSWPEIKQHLLSTDETQNRPDLVSRVFRAKVEELKADILKRNFFGKVAAFMYTIEFQKRGLPHAHFLIILSDEYKLLTPESYDKFVCAELPNADTEKHLYSRVLQHMMHGPCGDLNPTNSCMGKKGLCKFNYPKDFAEQTSKGKNSYPIYKRRNTGKLVHIREQYLDNSWVVPYNPYLLCKFDCHINVEVCSDIKVVKYIYKYICKGHDKIVFSVHGNEEIDEIKEYRSARWVTPPEAAWRLFGFPISEMTPSVYHLQLHLEGQQFVSFKSTESVNRILNNPMIRKTMLTEFFTMNSNDEHSKDMQLLYKEFPEHFVWSPGYKMWTRRQKRNVIGRVVTCHPTEGERYYLRLLLMNVRGPKSYEDLRTVNGVPCSTFRESAEKRGLLYCSNSLIECMSEAVGYQMPYSLRRLFATLLVYCSPTNPKELWEMFEDSMSEDFKRFSNIMMQSVRHNVLSHINDILYSMGHDINEYKLVPENIRPSVTAKDAKDQSGAFFIDGPGGTGKTLLYRALLATIRSQGFIALATATSGVAASVLPGGRTVHSRFKMPIDIDDNFCCNISKQSSLATLIRDAKLIV
ncbi:PREDICTED: uncharacterized protein LOC109215991 [Nicotiana attenuata]|uniref:uncharacterized protein LOC109215991 n=1 Tax=Nicotiana attenuata TaxID=49451 RepID=UPI000904F2A6|nr:PREDICTED: uncharacterized protein LOC109215991 [Nicotiana attenuata]